MAAIAQRRVTATNGLSLTRTELHDTGNAPWITLGARIDSPHNAFMSVRHRRTGSTRGQMNTQSSLAATGKPDSPPLIGRSTLAVTIGNMLEFYDFITYSFFAIQIGHTFFPSSSQFGSLMAVTGDVRRRFCDPADRRHRDRLLFRSRGPSSGDDPELCDDGRRDHRAGADAVLCHHRHCRARDRHSRAHGAGIFARRRGRAHHGLSDGSRRRRAGAGWRYRGNRRARRSPPPRGLRSVRS